MVSIDEAQNQLAANAQQAEKERQRVASASVKDNPSMSQLLQRGQSGMGAIVSAKDIEAQNIIAKEKAISELKTYQEQGQLVVQ